MNKYRYLTIKIDLERSSKRAPFGTEYKDELWLVDILHGGTKNSGGVRFAVKASGHQGKDLKKVLRKIKGALMV